MWGSPIRVFRPHSFATFNYNWHYFLKILIGKKHPQIKVQRIQKVWRRKTSLTQKKFGAEKNENKKQQWSVTKNQVVNFEKLLSKAKVISEELQNDWFLNGFTWKNRLPSHRKIHGKCNDTSEDLVEELNLQKYCRKC